MFDEFHWRPGIGDPTVAGWITVALYFVTAGLAVYLSRRCARNGHPSNERWFWLTIAAIFGCLGLNKQLDLQSAVTEIGRWLSRAGGWYDNRIVVQVFFVILFAGLLLAAIVYAARAARAFPWPTRVAILGMALVALFVAVRAASFHHVDAALGLEWQNIRLNNFLEIGGISIVLAGAIAALFGQRTAYPTDS